MKFRFRPSSDPEMFMRRAVRCASMFSARSNRLGVVGWSGLRQITSSVTVNEVEDTIKEGYKPSKVNRGLSDAITGGKVDRIKALISENIDINKKIKGTGSPPLVLAARYSNLDIMKTLLDANADVNATDSEGHTALHVTADAVSFNYDSRITDTLLLAGADVNQQDKDGRTALMRLLDPVIFLVDLRNVKLLLDFGSDVNLCAKDGKTAVSLAKDRAITAPYDSDYWSDLLLDTSSGTSSDTSSDTSSGTSSGSSSDSVSTSDWSDIDADSLDAYETNQEVLKLVRHHEPWLPEDYVLRHSNALVRRGWRDHIAHQEWQQMHADLEQHFNDLMRLHPEDYRAIARAGKKVKAHATARPSGSVDLAELQRRHDAHLQQLHELAQKLKAEQAFERLYLVGELLEKVKAEAASATGANKEGEDVDHGAVGLPETDPDTATASSQ